MKVALSACIIFFAWILGYLIEPTIEPLFLSDKKPETEEPADPDQPTPAPAPAPAFDLSQVRPDQLPPTVALKQTSKFRNNNAGTTITVDAGGSVKLIALEGNYVVISRVIRTTSPE